MTMMKKGSPFPRRRLPIANSKSGETLAVRPAGYVAARPVDHIKQPPRLSFPRPKPPATQPAPTPDPVMPVDHIKQPPRPSFASPKPTVAQPAPTPESVMHACRPQEHVKSPPRYIPAVPAGQKPVRPPSVCDVPVKPVLWQPAFLTRPPGGASERQTGGFGSLSSVEHPTPVTVRAPAASAPGPYKGYKGRMDLIDPDEIPS